MWELLGPQMRTALVCWAVIFAAITTPLADEQIRRAQEEMRKRNLYFGDVDGRASPELAEAIRRYQARKGFAVTGAIDEETANSLDIQITTSSSLQPPVWPDLPILKGDTARALSESAPAVFEEKVQQNPEVSPEPAPPAEPPSTAQDLSPDQVQRLVEDYLRDAEKNNVARQIEYYAFPVQYFDHGRVGREFVRRDTGNYVKRWPQRNYKLTAPVAFAALGEEGETTVEFPITFSVKNQRHAATGKTKNFWTIKPQGSDLKIIAIREERLRD